MDEIRNKAHELLDNGEVQLIIGYEQGSGNKTRPVFISNTNDINKLIFDSRCTFNLAVYLTKPEIKSRGKAGVIAPVPVLRSVVQLASENQVTDESAVILGITPEGNLHEFKNLREIEDFLERFQMSIEERDRNILTRIDNMSVEERWDFWLEQLRPCFKCYACRAACPMCYCSRCTVEQNQPQWIPVPSHILGNIEWHFMRVMHLAGRCVDCGACATACPVAVPLNLLTRKMMVEISKQFGEYKPSLKKGNVMSNFKTEDSETFIL